MRSILLSAAIACALSGCTLAEWNSINRSFNPTVGDARLVDAKQRAVISIVREEPNPLSPGQTVKRTIVCAEPSPDALQATAAALSASGAIDKGTVGAALQAAAGTSESVASIGLRTQSIQLLRDAYYRLCEGYANGAMDDIAFNILQQRYQNHTVALLAIEQLTGAVVGAHAAIAAQGNAQSEAQTPAVEVKTETTSEPNENQDTEEGGATVTADGKTTTTATATVTPAKDSRPNGDLPEHISRAVAAITQDALNQDYTLQICLEFAREIFTKEASARIAISPAPLIVGRQQRTIGEAVADLPASVMAVEYCQQRLAQDSRRQIEINNLLAAKAEIVKSVASGIRQTGSRHISDQHVFEIMQAINTALPSDPAASFALPPHPILSCGEGTKRNADGTQCIVDPG